MKRECAAVFLAAFLASCATPGPAPEPRQAGQETKGPAEALSRMQQFFDSGAAKIGEGSVMEGARLLVAVLSERQALANPSREAQDLAGRAEAELTGLASALALDSGVEWLDVNKNQLSGSALDIGSPKSMQPSVILSYTMGRGRTLVAGAPIVFEFVKGGGVATAFVTTNEYGQATCSIARLDSQTAESVIRAGVVFTVGGFSYRLQGVERDFVFVPPSRRATILALERLPKALNQPPIILDPVYNTLKGVAFDFSNYDGTLMGDAFMRVFSGDPKAIQSLGMQKEVSYLVMVLNDCTVVNQVVIDGKTYNIFKSQTTATTRIIRVADGKILYSGAVQAVIGQGGDASKAGMDGLRKAAVEMSEKLSRELGAITAALAEKPR